MNPARSSLALILMFSALALNAGCSSDANQGTIEILISDHRDAIGDFSSFVVDLTSIYLHQANEPFETGWLQLQPLLPIVDLTQVIGDDSVLVVRQNIPSGSYDAVRINASEVRGVLLDGEEILLGSFSEAARQDVSFASGQTAALLLDLKVQSRQDHPDEGYVLLLANTRRIPRP